MTMRRFLTSSAAGLAALTVLAEACPALPASAAGTPEAAVRARVTVPLAAAPPGTGVPAEAAPPSTVAFSVVDRPVIRSVRVLPRAPVARPGHGVRLVVEVEARGVAGPRGVTLRVEPDGRRGRARSAAPPPAAAADGGGFEVWRFNPPVRLTRWYPAGRWRAVATAKGARGGRTTAATPFLFRKASTLTGVRAARAPKRPGALLMTGTLMRVDPTGRFDYWSFPRQRVTLQFRKHGGRKWKSVAAARTNREGSFARRVRNRPHGVWRVVYPGTRQYAGVTRAVRHRGHN
ncbi:hypothetical protein [Sphaerisporangium dianthi]|uniref:Uncharacterized protein n=1 Tax=Sphaerisporangium dianthi TaxID=1436120 RepID=A0ABV9CHM6_9ACTN